MNSWLNELKWKKKLPFSKVTKVALCCSPMKREVACVTLMAGDGCGVELESSMQSADQPVTAYGVWSIMVWGGISLTRKTPHVHIACNLTAQRYVDEVLRPQVAPLAAANGGAFVYMDDINARPHRGRVATAFLAGEFTSQECSSIERMVWPASSPDLNPIPVSVGLAEAICISPHQRQQQPGSPVPTSAGLVKCHHTAACHQTDQHHDHRGRPPCHDGAGRSLTAVVDTLLACRFDKSL